MEVQAAEREVLEAYSGAVLREMHIVRKEPLALFQQLYNRLRWDLDSGGGLLGGVVAVQYRHRSAVGPLWLERLTRVKESSALRATLAGHTGAVTSCAFSPDGRTIVSGGTDGRLRLSDTAISDECVPRVLGGHWDSAVEVQYGPG
ncbi:MAG TPA: hypothetical protein VFE45_11100 [Coriobacteriia bacterium]|nr:hypothetical protein [Coriobacteriia bacterium]